MLLVIQEFLFIIHQITGLDCIYMYLLIYQHISANQQNEKVVRSQKTYPGHNMGYYPTIQHDF